jgi:hypothetical protein
MILAISTPSLSLPSHRRWHDYIPAPLSVSPGAVGVEHVAHIRGAVDAHLALLTTP